MTTARYTARTVTLDDLAPRHAAWRKLAAETIEPHPFYAPDFLIAARTHLTPARALQLVIVEDGETGDLAALFPLERPHLRDGLVTGALALYRNPFVCLTAPLIRTDGKHAILAAALRHIAGMSPRLIVPMIGAGRATAALLREVGADAGLPFAEIDARARPAVITDLSADAYRAAFWKKDVRAGERRRLRRLAERGAITWRRIAANETGGREALEVFLALEAKGWKGREGTAMAREPATRAFAREAFGPPESGAVYEVLSVDGKPVAVNLTLVAGSVGFALKSAYDEDFASFGVGTLLDGWSLSLTGADGPLERLDSCAQIGHPLARRWRQEERIGRYLLGLAPDVRLDPMTRWLRLAGPYGLWSGFGK